MNSSQHVKKINGHEVKFTSYPANRVVIAEIMRCSDDVLDWLEREYGFEYPLFACHPNRLLDKVYMPGTLRSIARCHPEDSFDLSIGEDVAYKKLQKKYWEKYAVRAMKLLNHMQNACDALTVEVHSAAIKAESIDPTRNVKA